MAISITKYVTITSGVGGGAAVRQRDLIGRLFTTNPRVPIDSLVELESADDAAAYFGSSSEEYARAQFYFGWVSKNITAPEKLQFARWAETAREPRIYGAAAATLAALRAITTGSLTITAGTAPAVVTGLDFSGDASMAAVASTLQAALRATATDQLTSATVTYDAVAGAFNLVGTTAETAPISVDTGATAIALGWGSTAVFSPGVDAASITDCLVASAEASNNFGSFLFLPEFTVTQHQEAADWNAVRNVEFMYCVRASEADYVALGAALIATAGTAITYAPTAGEYDEMVPMVIMAATDYDRRNSVQNYMYQQFPGLTAKVNTNALSDALDAIRVNYYGVTQTAGQLLAFYQRGTMGGGATAPVDQNTYANEMWLKDAARARLMTLFLTLSRVSANETGRGQVIAILQDAIDRALFNGVISVDKPLSEVQKLYITQVTGDDLAWHQVQGAGYWLSAAVASEVTGDGRTEYKITYTLIYAKDDAVRKVEGTHTLI